MDFPKFPDSVGFKTWRLQAYDVIIYAVKKHPRRIRKWLTAVETATKMEDLRDSKQYELVSTEITFHLLKILQGNFKKTPDAKI